MVGQLTRMPARRTGGSGRGFSLVEVLVTLAVLGLILLLGLGLVWQQRRVHLRLEARAAADRALAETLETLRSGAVPLASGPVPRAGGATGSGSGAGGHPAQDLQVVVRVVPAEPPADLYQAEVTARYTVAGQRQVRTVRTLFWRPGRVKGR